MPAGFFSSDSYLDAATHAFHPGKRWQAVEVSVQGRVFRVAVVGRDTVVHDCHFLDYLEPLPEGARAARRASFLRRTLSAIVPVGDYTAVRGVTPAPLIRWSGFSSLDDFRDEVRSRSKTAFSKTERLERKLAREVGDLRYVEHEPSDAVLRTLFAWKSEQFRRASLPDLAALPSVRALFERLVHTGAVRLTTMYAGDRLAAIHLGPRYQGRTYYWVPAYDSSLGNYSPGNTLLHELMRWSFEAGDESFELLLGNEDYKWRYATDVALVVPSGRPPMRDVAERAVRRVGRGVARRAPGAEAKLRSVMRRLRERGLLR